MKKIVVFGFLSLIPLIIGAAEAMKISRNRFGDITVRYHRNKRVPNLFRYRNSLVVIPYAPDEFNCEDLPCFLGRTKELGNLFGNEYAGKHFPEIQNGMIMGGCSVIFVQDKERTFVVLVQVKKSKYLMNAAGFAERGESFKDAAIREAFEETGLKIKPDAWEPLASWTLWKKYAGLSIPGETVSGYAFSEMPAQWKDKISGPITNIKVENEEIESITLFDVAYLPLYQKFNEDRVFSSDFSGHHLNLVILAAFRAGLAGV